MEFKDYVTTFALVGLFSLALLSFGYGLQTSNNVDETILDDPYLSKFNNTIGTQLNDFSDNSNTYWNATLDEQGTEQQPLGELTIGSAYHSITTFGSFMWGMASGSLRLVGSLGGTTLILSVLLGIVVIGGALAWWRLVKIGS